MKKASSMGLFGEIIMFPFAKQTLSPAPDPYWHQLGNITMHFQKFIEEDDLKLSPRAQATGNRFVGCYSCLFLYQHPF